MLNKKLLNFLLNVKHTLVDDVKFFESLSEEQRTAIRLVSADGAKWIASCVEEFCTNADKPIFLNIL